MHWKLSFLSYIKFFIVQIGNNKKNHKEKLQDGFNYAESSCKFFPRMQDILMNEQIIKNGKIRALKHVFFEFNTFFSKEEWNLLAHKDVN